MTGTRRGRDGDVTGCGGERPAPPCRGPPSPASPRDSAAPFRAATSSSRPRHVPDTSPPRHVISPPRTAAVPVQFRNGLRRQAFRAPVTPPSHPVTSPLITIHFESRPRHGGGGGTLCVISPAVATASSPSTKSCSAGRPGREPWVGALSCTARTTHHVCHQDCDPRDAGSPERFWRRPWRCLPGN